MNQNPIPSPKSNQSAGSALLVTLLVVSLLLVMVLSLVVVVRMELRKVVAHQELMQARANARLGLEMAIAKLQIAAGPDTRVTAPVYTDNTAQPNILHISRAVDSAPFRQESGELRINPRYGQTTQHGTTEHGITMGYFLSYDPLTGFDPQNYHPFNGGTQVDDGHVLLVGPGSVTLDDNNNDGVPDGFVAAPLRPIENVTNSDQPPIGSYAYQSLGLPVNVQTGGFRRDLTAVMREMEDNLNGTSNDTELQALFDFQQARMQRWRDQTIALEEESRPSGMPRHRWNALKALSLRDDQNMNRPTDFAPSNSGLLNIHPPFREKVFPPNIDISRHNDPGGASWRQLLSHATKWDRLMNSDRSFLQVNMPSEISSQVNPVVARFLYNFYMTLDWPILRIHHVPVIVLWNPYDVPIGPREGQAWHFLKKFEKDHINGLTYRLLMQHDDWNSGVPVWTPTHDSHILYNNITGTYNYWHFRLLKEPNDPYAYHHAACRGLHPLHAISHPPPFSNPVRL